MSAAFIVLGLLLVGGAISPLLAFFQVVQAARYFIGLAYIVLVTVTVLWLAGKLFVRAAKRYLYVLRTRIAVLVVAEMVLLSFTATCHPFEFRWEVTSLVFATTLLVVQLVPSRATRWNAYTAFSVNEIAIIFILSGIMLTVPFSRFFSTAHVNTVSTVCYSAVAAIIAASAFLRARELFPAHPCKNETGNESYATLQSASTAMRFQPLSHPRVRNAALLVMRASVLSVFIAVFVYSFVPFGSSKYTLDIVFMGSALACTALGFKAEEPTLRRMGLVFAIASIMKMVLIDTMMYDALEKAVAYIVGGAVCFALGALYNYAVKRLA